MSLESLNALRQLVQVEQQGESAQNDNLNSVQQSVQSQGTSEAQRVDQVNLEMLKANYDKELQQVQVNLLESRRAREAVAEQLAMITAVGVGVISAGDAILSVAKDMGLGNFSLTGNKDQSSVVLGEPSRGSVRDIDPNSGRVLTSNRQGTSASDVYFVGDNPDGTQTVQGARQNSNGSVDPDIRSATVSRDDISNFLTQNAQGTNQFALVNMDGSATDRARLLGLADGSGKFTQRAQDLGLGNAGESFNVNGITNFDKLQSLDALDPNRSASRAFFNQISDPMKKDEVDGFMRMVNRSGTMNSGAVNDALSASGRNSQIGLADFGKSALNEVIRMAETTVPFIQAWMSAKDKLQQTEIELQAAREKLQAALQKVKELQKMLISAGVNVNAENNQASATIM